MDIHRTLVFIATIAIILKSGYTKDILEGLDESQTYDDLASKDYRLPNSMHPTSYEINLFPKLIGDFSFRGEVKINVTVDVPTKLIVLHYGSIFNVKSSVSAENTKLDIEDASYDNETEKYSILLKESLKKGDKIVLTLTYDSYLRNDMIGFYKSSYITDDNLIKWLAATQFETTHARHAFPCFDEPGYKATFKISLTRSKEFISISNMPLENTQEISSDLYQDNFKTTVPMSTYLVAFAIFDFAKNSSETLTVWARPDMIDQSRYALKIGSNALAYLQKLFDQPYELPKMDMVAIPDFSAGAMENWGLITYRESRMLYDEKECSVVAQQNVASVIIHEITHMWFGNLLTPSWWSYLWLSEGFARYFQYFGTAKIENTWNMEGQFLVEQHLAALGVDGIEESQSMTRIVNNRSQIAGIGDSITYAKGASVIRMMSHFIGIDKFHEALRLYVRESKTNGIVKPENLWLAFQNTAGNSDIVIETIMNNWTKEPGFPVLSVTIEKGKATLKQHRFLLRNLKSTPVNTNWWIPITYTTKKQTNFVSTEVKHWMKNENEIISIDASDSDWVIFNVQQTGFYRVNYDNASWYRIIDELNSNNFTKIHEYNRAGIIDDLLNLARAGLLDYRIALDGLQYLRQEKNYLPFKAAFRGLDYLTQRFSGDEANYVLYKKYVLSLIENVYRGLGYVDRKNDDRLTVQLRRELNDLACKFDHKECVSNSLEFFRNWINATSRNRIEPNQRSAAYCTGILHGNLDDWKLLWNHYKTSKVVSEQVVVLNALGCSRNIDILEQYLRCAISPYEVYRIRKQDSTSVFSAIYSSSIIGINTVLDFVDKNHDAMAKYYDGYDTIASILSGLSRYLSTDELINKFERLIKKHTEFSKITKSLTSSLELAKYELNWYKNNVDRIISRINDNNHKSDDPIIDEYRLPNNVIPQKYILSLEPFLVPDNFTFNGNVQIVALVVKKTNKIVLHASNITVHSVNVMVNNEEVNVTESYESIYDFFVIKLENALNEKTEVNIIFRYTGNLNNAMLGFYKSYYIDSDGKQRWLATTQMEPVGARKMFPCFDEPAMKAVFTVEVLIPDSYHAISNTKPREIKKLKDTDKTLYRFEDTELMSTYLLALVVSDFNHVHHEGEKNYKIWFRPNSFNETSYSLSLMEPLVKTYEELLQHNYTLDKLDMIALPDLSFGAMENWGLLTFREQYLLLQSEETNIRDIQTGTNIISHEIAHQWFGNLVTPLWWKYAWLNEGFATYFEYFGTSHIKPEWELEYQFVVNELHSAFKRDALTSTHPMSYDVSTPTEIGDIFDKITYAKAGSVIRMIEKTYGSDVFYAALQNYLEERKYNVATPEDLYKAISNQLADETSANGVSKFLNSWTTQAGFPVVNVTIDSDGLATLSQERFFLRNENGESVENIWEIPITWTSEKNPNFNNTKPQFWLNQIEMKIMTDNSEGWKIFNIQQAGYYRVNYDIANWKRIIDALTQQKFEKIHKVNRAALIDDLMNLARVGYVDYDLLFSATEYLKYENEYLPWRAFFNGLTYLHNKFEAQEIFESLKQHVLKLINSIIEKSLNKESQLSDLLLMELHKWACKYQSKYCYEMMTSPNTRPGIYCEKARTSYMWNDIWKAYINSTITSEKRVILKALGCTEHTYLINTLLNRAISENSGIRYGDSIGVFASVYENSQIGVKSVLRYMIMAFDNIYNYYEDESAIKNIMGGLAERISTEKLYEQYRYVTDFLISKVPTLNNTLQSYNDLIIYELNWYKKNIPKISYWLEKLYPLKNNNRLPTTLYPLNYNLSIAIRNNMLLEGSVKINIRVDKPAFKIVLNSYELDIVPKVIVYETPIGTSDKDLKYFDILGYELISENQQLIIYLTTHIEVPKVTVEIGFYKVDISDKEMKGLYRGRYINNNEYHTYFATYFQPNYARMVFPCFDEPAFKAKFKIHILRDKSYKTLSNMPLERSFPNDTQYTWDIYKESLNMSTYLLGFVVSNFVPIKNDKEKFNIWGREEIIQYGDEVQYAAYKYYKSINQIFVQEDESEKIDFVGLPNFPIGAMENWGLFTFRESQLFYDKDIIPSSRRYSILTTVSHEISHKYFGNLVTCEWWSYTWLNEGFAQYFQWLLLEAINENDFIHHFMVNDMHEVFGVDGFIYSHPLNYPVSDPKDLKKPFDIISYKKGASIIRMLHWLIGDDNFYYIIRRYLNKNKYGIVNPEKLWNEIDGYIRNDHNLEETMNEWVNKPGYPVVSISYDKYYKKIRITQQRFLYYAYDGPSRFHIPISIATEENPNFSNTKPQFWLRTTENTFDCDLEDQWIVLNIQQLGYYRVNYDNTLMTRLINILNSNKYSTIHVINRAQIIDDAFNLARASNTYSKALKLALYLRREKEHLPWKAFGRGINNLWEHIRHSGKIEALQRYVLYLTDEHVERLGFIDYYDDSDKLGNLSKNNQLNRELILSLNCKFGGKTCIDESTKIFKSTEQFKTIPRNAKPAILCTGIKHTDHNNWSKLLSAYTETKLHSEQILYLDALGCSEDDMTLNKYLKYIFNENALKLIRKEDIPRAFASIYTSSDIGWKKCYEYLINHYVEIYDLLNNRNDVGALFYEIVIRIPDIETLDKFKFFMQNNEENLAPITATLLEATEIAEKLISTNQQLPSQIQSILQDILYQIKHEKNSNGNSGASNLNIVFLTIVSLISLLLFK